MADTPGVDQSYKLAALQALASGGTAAKAAVDQARTAMQASQTDALKQAAANSAAYGLGQAGTDALQKPISGAYGNRLTNFDRITAPSVARFTDLQAPTANLFDTKSAAILAKRSSGSGGGGGSGTTTVEDALPPSPVDRTFFSKYPVTKADDQAMQNNLNFALQTGATPSSVASKLKQEFGYGTPDVNQKAIIYYYQVYNQAYQAQQAAAAAAKKKK